MITDAQLMTHWDDCGGAHLALWIDTELVFATDLPVMPHTDGNMEAQKVALLFLKEGFADRQFPERVFSRIDRQTVWNAHGQLSKFEIDKPAGYTRKPPKISDAVKRLEVARKMADEIRERDRKHKPQEVLF